MDKVEATPPSEDSGTLAQSRFFYQHQYTAYWCIQMLMNDEIEYIICEHHDDLLIHWRDGHWDFMQVKTRGEGKGEWTLGDLLNRKGSQSIIEKLYDKKCQFGDSAPHRYVFVSNMGASGKNSPNLIHLKRLLNKGANNWNDEECQLFNNLLTKFAKKVKHDDKVKLKEFILALDIQTEQHNLNSIRYHNLAELQKALKETQGVAYSHEDLEVTYESILKIVRDANITERIDEKPLAEKKIFLAQIEKAINPPSSSHILLQRGPHIEVYNKYESTDEVSNLQRKARRVYYDPEIVILLMDLRASSKVFNRKNRHFRHTRTQLQHLSLDVQRICVSVKVEARQKNFDGFGQWQLLEDQLQQLAEKYLAQNKQPPIDVNYLIGVVGDLIGKCKVGLTNHETI